MKNKMKEKVLCVRTEWLYPYSYLEGFCFTSLEVQEDIKKVVELHGVFKERGEVEDSPTFKQIIPQVALIAEDKIAVHRIPESGGEARLHHLSPIFFGGHINEKDGTSITEAAIREFAEEVGYEHTIILSEIGIVNLNDTPVNKVHFGVVFIAIGKRALVPAHRDEGVAQIEFMDWGDAANLLDTMTPWSRVAFQLIREKYQEGYNK